MRQFSESSDVKHRIIAKEIASMLASPQRLFRMATGTSDPVVKPRPKTIARGVKPGRIRAVLATLCSEIARNVIPVGATLPPEPELEARFGVGARRCSRSDQDIGGKRSGERRSGPRHLCPAPSRLRRMSQSARASSSNPNLNNGGRDDPVHHYYQAFLVTLRSALRFPAASDQNFCGRSA